MHFQAGTAGMYDAAALLPRGGVVKAIDRGDILRDAKRANPNVTTFFRHWDDGLQQFGGTFDDDVARARRWFSTHVDGTFVEQYAPFVNLIGEYNEYNASSHTAAEVAQTVQHARAFTRVWNDEYRSRAALEHIELALSAAPIGNDIPIEVARLAIANDCWLDYHAYTYWHDEDLGGPIAASRAANDWHDLSGRWDTMERRWGLKPRWVFGEFGPFNSVLGGWRAADCLGGSVSALLYAVAEWIDDVQLTAAYREGRVLIPSWFTTGGGAQWAQYELDGSQLSALAQLFAARWRPGTAAPPPPAEDGAVDYIVVAHLVQNLTKPEVAHVLDETFDAQRSVVYSADDAARLVAPGLPGSRVVAWEPERYGASIVDWLHARGVDVVETKQLPATTSDVFDFPVGTSAERAAAADDWPGTWYDATRYAQPYTLNGTPQYHTGADLNLSADADRGAAVYAAADGVVIYAERVPAPSTWGRLVVIRHGDSVCTRYAHLGSMLVGVGDVVRRGQQIGTIGGAEFGLANHLHFDVSTSGKLIAYPRDWPGATYSRVVADYVDPLQWVLAHRT